jgi:hypothetical protein
VPGLPQRRRLGFHLPLAWSAALLSFLRRVDNHFKFCPICKKAGKSCDEKMSSHTKFLDTNSCYVQLAMCPLTYLLHTYCTYVGRCGGCDQCVTCKSTQNVAYTRLMSATVFRNKGSLVSTWARSGLVLVLGRGNKGSLVRTWARLGPLVLVVFLVPFWRGWLQGKTLSSRRTHRFSFPPPPPDYSHLYSRCLRLRVSRALRRPQAPACGLNYCIP